MPVQTFYIRNMVSSRCIRSVGDAIKLAGAHEEEKTTLGKAVISFERGKFKKEEFVRALREEGFELIESKEEQAVEQIKVAAIELVYHANNANSLIRNSDYLSEKVGMTYNSLSKLFSERTGHTLEKYIILLKIEKAKELLSYNEYTLSEIAYMMGYSSVQYLSNQFRQITGYTVSEYKTKGINDRRPLDKLLE